MRNRVGFVLTTCVLMLAHATAYADSEIPAAPGVTVMRLTVAPGESQLAVNFARALAGDAFGGLHVVWHDTRDGESRVFYKHSIDGGHNWADAQPLSAGNARDPALAVEGHNVHVVWTQLDADAGPMLVWRQSSDGGSNWSDPRLLTDPGSGRGNPSIAVAGPRVHVVWVDDRDGQAEIYTRRSLDGGASWQTPVRLSNAPYESWVPSIEVDGPRVYVAWVDYRDANEEVYFRRSLDGGGQWGAIRRLTADFADSFAATVDSSGSLIHLAWFDRRAAGVTDRDVELALNDALLLVGVPVRLPPPRTADVYYLPGFGQRIATKLTVLDSAGPQWIAAGGDPRELAARLKRFHRLMGRWENGWEIFYKRSADQGVSWSGDRRLTVAPRPSVRPAVAANNNAVHIAWSDAREDGELDVFLMSSLNAGGRFGRTLRVADLPGDSRHVNIVAVGRVLHLVWQQQQEPGNTEIYYARVWP